MASRHDDDDALWCKVRYCDCMSSVCLSVRLSFCNVGGLWSHRLGTQH